MKISFCHKNECNQVVSTEPYDLRLKLTGVRRNAEDDRSVLEVEKRRIRS